MNLCLDSLLKRNNVPRFSFTLKSMFLGKTLSDSLFNSVNLNFLRTEALSFYKVPFVVCFLYQTPAISGSVAVRAVQWRHFPHFPSTTPQPHPKPALLKPALPVNLLSFFTVVHMKQPQPPVPGGKDTARAYHRIL